MGVIVVVLHVISDHRCQVAAIPSPAARSADPQAATTLYACGSTGDVAGGSKEISDLFAAAKSVCCDDLHEQCDDSKWFPDTCNSVGCARVVDIVSQSCAATFAVDGFFRTAFKPSLDLVVAECVAAPRTQVDHAPTYVITDPQIQVSPITTCHGRLVDGATSVFPPARSGQDAVVLQAPKGMQMRVSAETMYFSPHANIRVYDGPDQTAPELGILRGTTLDAREFVSSTGVLRVLRAVDLDDDAGLPLVFSLTIGCVCKDGDNCGHHATCVAGMCQCDSGYSGATCDVVVDPCDGLDCGLHGRCADGTCQCDSGYSGATCDVVDDPCDGLDCGTHGHCADGTCQCSQRYSGHTCEIAPKPCCSTRCGCSSGSSGCCSGEFCCGGGSRNCAPYCDAVDYGWDRSCDRKC